MNIEKHLKIIGTAYLILGIIGAVLSGFLTVRDVYLFQQVGWQNMGGPMARRAFMLFAIVFVISSLQICLGLGLMKGKPWATRVVGFLVAALSLLAFPFGTILSVYTLIVLVEIDKKEAIKTEPRN